MSTPAASAPLPRRYAWWTAVQLGTYTAALCLAELLLVFVDSLAGAVAYAVVLLALVNQAAWQRDRGADAPDSAAIQQEWLLALALVPVLQLVAVASPSHGLTEVERQLLILVPLLPALAWAAWIARVPALALMRGSRGVQLGITAAGLPLGYLGYRLAGSAPVTERGRLGGPVAPAAVVALAAAVEELVFRGFLLRTLMAVFPASAFAWSGVVFALAYLGVRPFAYVALMAGFGFLFGWLAQQTRALAGVVGAHVLLSVGAVVLWPAVFR